jgi:uncharacterized membrane protein (UPF0127 family)
MRLLLLAAVAACLVACSSSDDAVRDFSARDVTLPDGTTIKAEVMTNPVDMSRGMMFRDSLAPDRGMLFIHGSPGKYPYWMFQVKIPLDIIWMDQNRRVVEISANTPACASKSAKDCPNYGGHEKAMYVLEIGGGQGARHGVQVGSVINF